MGSKRGRRAGAEPGPPAAAADEAGGSPSTKSPAGVPNMLPSFPLRLIIVGHNPSDHAWRTGARAEAAVTAGVLHRTRAVSPFSCQPLLPLHPLQGTITQTLQTGCGGSSNPRGLPRKGFGANGLACRAQLSSLPSSAVGAGKHRRAEWASVGRPRGRQEASSSPMPTAVPSPQGRGGRPPDARAGGRGLHGSGVGRARHAFGGIQARSLGRLALPVLRPTGGSGEEGRRRLRGLRRAGGRGILGAAPVPGALPPAAKARGAPRRAGPVEEAGRRLGCPTCGLPRRRRQQPRACAPADQAGGAQAGKHCSRPAAGVASGLAPGPLQNGGLGHAEHERCRGDDQGATVRAVAGPGGQAQRHPAATFDAPRLHLPCSPARCLTACRRRCNRARTGSRRWAVCWQGWTALPAIPPCCATREAPAGSCLLQSVLSVTLPAGCG